MFRFFQKVLRICSFAPCRVYKYDDQQWEYFVETQDEVKIRRSDIDCARQMTEVPPTEDGKPAEMPVLPRKPLMEGESAPAVGADGKHPGSNDLTTAAAAKENLDKFLDSLHKKAAQATSWVVSLEPPSLANPTERQKELLGYILLLKRFFACKALENAGIMFRYWGRLGAKKCGRLCRTCRWIGNDMSFSLPKKDPARAAPHHPVPVWCANCFTCQEESQWFFGSSAHGVYRSPSGVPSRLWTGILASWNSWSNPKQCIVKFSHWGFKGIFFGGKAQKKIQVQLNVP